MLGFISPDGKFYKCEYYAHMKLADELLEKIYKQQSNKPVDKLCKTWLGCGTEFFYRICR